MHSDKVHRMGLFTAIWRLAQQRWGEDQARHALPKDALARLTVRIAASEQQHTGQIRVVAEPGLPWSYLYRHATPRERALMLFSKHRVWDTEHNNGVLIYLLIPEHAIEIVADGALSSRISSDQWNAVMSDMSACFRQMQYEDGLSAAIDAVSSQLIRHFPRSDGLSGYLNELPDTPVVG
ncbi:MAG: TPM domain-containing protein [Acidovorax sp.]|nr:MAG: TPM domain-containing protein [Acidovorax sp.]